MISYTKKDIAMLLELLPTTEERDLEPLRVPGGIDIETMVPGQMRTKYLLAQMSPMSWISYEATEVYDMLKNPANIDIQMEKFRSKGMTIHHAEMEGIKEILFETPLEELPLQVNGEFPILVKWRLEIGK